ADAVRDDGADGPGDDHGHRAPAAVVAPRRGDCGDAGGRDRVRVRRAGPRGRHDKGTAVTRGQDVSFGFGGKGPQGEVEWLTRAIPPSRPTLTRALPAHRQPC